jgi:dihydrofolate reductase
MKLTTVTMVTVDGVMQGLGGPEEDRAAGFERGGWQREAFDDVALSDLVRIYQRASAFLFGRRTYDIFAPFWGGIADPEHPIADALNIKPKYVASTTLTDPKWSHTTVLSGDLATAIADLKAQPGGEMQVHGSGALIRWLLDHRLVDEITLFVCPVIVGQGTRLFPDAGPDLSLELLESRSTPRGVTIQVYRPGGRPHYARADTED